MHENGAQGRAPLHPAQALPAHSPPPARPDAERAGGGGHGTPVPLHYNLRSQAWCTLFTDYAWLRRQ